MKHSPRLCLLSTAIAACLPSLSQAGEGGFIEDASASLTARNYYFSRDFSDIVGPNRQSKAEEWAQGFILNLKSGYTPGPVGFGVDAIGLLGIKLDSSPDRVNTGLLPTRESGKAADDYSRLGLAAKLRLSKTELKAGELQPNLPVLVHSDIRLLPPSYQGVSVVSNELAGLTLQAGHLNSTSLRNEAGDDRMLAMLGHLLLTAGEIAREKGFADDGYRVVINTNSDGGQTVFHVHVHLLGGRPFIFPPG